MASEGGPGHVTGASGDSELCGLDPANQHLCLECLNVSRVLPIRASIARGERKGRRVVDE